MAFDTPMIVLPHGAEREQSPRRAHLEMTVPDERQLVGVTSGISIKDLHQAERLAGRFRDGRGGFVAEALEERSDPRRFANCAGPRPSRGAAAAMAGW